MRKKQYTTFVVLLILGFFIFSLSLDMKIKAFVADNILRSFIGNTKTIALEAAYLNTADAVNVVKDSVLHKKAQGTSIAHPAQAYGSSNFSLHVINPLLTNSSVRGEGVWDTVKIHNGNILIAKTFLRVDAKRPTSEVTIVKMNMRQLRLHLVAGSLESAILDNKRNGKIPYKVMQSGMLVAAFNGGFQPKDGHYGFIIGDQTYLSLKNNLATLLIPYNGLPSITRFTGQRISINKIRAIRQNCPILIENGSIVTNLPAWNSESWGLTITNGMHTWRSGIGITKHGNLLYAAGPSLTPKTLAIALKATGAVDAMQLDINYPWTRYSVFTYQNKIVDGKPINSQMVPNNRYFTGYNKDFFYITRK